MEKSEKKEEIINTEIGVFIIKIDSTNSRKIDNW